MGLVFYLARKDLTYLLRARETLLWVFVMPVVFMYFIGTATSGFGGGGQDTLYVRGLTEEGAWSRRLRRLLEEGGFRVRPAAGRPRPPLLELPPDFDRRLERGERVEVRFRPAREDLQRDYRVLRVGRAVYTLLADLVALAAAGEGPTAAALAALEGRPRTVRIAVEAAGRRRRIPAGFEQTVQGVLVMFVLLALVTSGAVLLVAERRQGSLRRLAAAPVSRGQVVAGKLLGRLGLGVVEALFAGLAGTVLFGMRWGANLPMVGLLVAAWTLFCTALGMLLGTLSRTEGQAVGLGVLGTNLAAALGGCWWPIEITPPWMQTLQKLLPTGWAMDGLHRLISYGDPAAAALPHVIGLTAGALLLGAVAARRFRFQ